MGALVPGRFAPRLSRRLGGIGFLLVLAWLVVALRAPLLGAGLTAAFHAAGYGLSYRLLAADWGTFELRGLDLRTATGEPVLRAERLAIRYDPAHFLGGPHPYGIESVALEGPTLTYIRRADGSSNLTLPQSSGGSAGGQATLPAIALAIHGGTIGIRDDTRRFAHSRRLAIEGIDVVADLDPNTVSTWSAALRVLDADGTFPIAGRGTLDAPRGIELSRIAAKTLGLAALLDYGLNSRTLHFANGVLNDVDVRLYGLRDRDGTMQRHVAATANLDHFQPYLNGLVKPLRDGRGALRVYDDGLAFPKVDGSIAGVPVRIAGAIYDLERPTVRLGIAGRGDLAKLITLSNVAKTLPLSGPLAFKLLVEGDATSPMTLATIASPHLRYGPLQLEHPSGAVALHGSEAALLRSSVAYQGMHAAARGDFVLGEHTLTDMVATVDAPATHIPYAADLLGPMALQGTVVATGSDGALDTSGWVGGTRLGTRLAAAFAMRGNGSGTLGPLIIEGPGRRSLYARVALDAPQQGAAILALRRFSIALGNREPRMPGISPVPAVPLHAVLDGAVALTVAHHDVVSAMSLRAGALRAFGVSLRQLALTAMIGTRSHTLDVYGARAELAGGSVTAQGSFGNGGRLLLTASDLHPQALAGVNAPVSGGTLAGFAAVDGSAAKPHLAGSVAFSGGTLGGGTIRALPFDTHADLTYAHGALALSHAALRAGPIVAALAGEVAPDASYRIQLHAPSADVATLAALVPNGLRYPEGTLAADVRVSGRRSGAPAVDGSIEMPEGSLNGLAFRDASVALSGDASHLTARSGRVTVGTSTLGFQADVASASQSVVVHAPHVDLANFNDYFDQGDTLGGKGSIDLALANAPDRLTTSGSIRLREARVRHFDLGTTVADWNTAGGTIHTNAALGGVAGRVTESGDVAVAQAMPLRDPLHRTRLALDIHARNVDLGTWLPVAGVHAPVLGFVDANATIRGSYPDLAMAADAALRDGMARGIPIRNATLAVRASQRRATIARAEFDIDGLTANASGFTSLTQGGPFDLTVVARSPDAAVLAKTLTGTAYDASGSVVAVTHATGTSRAPRIVETLDANAARFGRFVIPRAHAQLAVERTRASLDAAELDLQQGRITAAATLPLRNDAIDAAAPLRADLSAEGVDLAQFATLFPQGTSAAGMLTGRIAVEGTLDDPAAGGALALTGGSFAGPQMRSRLSDVTAHVQLSGRTVALQDAVAHVGGGTINANAHVTVADLRAPGDSADVAAEVVSNAAVLDIPNLFRGRLNGDLALARAPGSATFASGHLDVSSARVATVALLPKNQSVETTATPLPVDFNVAVNVGNDVRVQGGPVDIGAKGHLNLGGTVAAPTLAGRLTSTGGTLNFYRTFRVRYPSTVAFHRYNGVIPDVDALATTSVDNPQTDVSMHVTGPATQMNVALSSDPTYTREQIVGLLLGVQSLGAVSGVASSNGGPASNPFRAAAMGQLGTLLTQNILEPFSSQLGGAVGLTNLELNYEPGGAYGFGAQKSIGRHVNAVFAESFGYPTRESIGLLDNPNRSTAFQFAFYTQPQANRLRSLQPGDFQTTNQSVTASEPATGSNGFSFSIQKKFH